MVNRIFKGNKISFSRIKKIKTRFPRIKWNLERPAKWLDAVATMTLKLGTLALVLFLIVFIARIFQKQGYVIQAFSVPASLEQSGYKGAVIASKIQDEVLEIKRIAQSVKTDSTKLIGNEELEFNLSVMGVGVSLSSVAYRIREMFGRKNEIIQGEITLVDNTLGLTLRMSGYPAQNHEEEIANGNQKAAIARLLRKAGEMVVANRDPYRLAVYCYRENRYEDAINLTRKIIRERPQEVHWAYLAWGSVLEAQNNQEEAAKKFSRAIALNPAFGPAYTRLSWVLSRQRKNEEAVVMMRKALEVDPMQIDRWINLGWMLSSSNPAGADSAFQRATEIAPDDPMVWSSWANSKMESGQLDEAIPLSERAEALAGENAYGYMVKAIGSFVRRDTANAYRQLEIALDFDPTLLFAIEANINVNWQKRDFTKLVAIYEKSDFSNFSRYKRQRLLNLVAMSYNYLGNSEAAFAVVREAIAADPTRGYPYSTLAEVYALGGDMEKFYENLEKAFQLGMSTASITFDLEPYASLEKEERLRKLMERYGKLKG